MVALPGGPPAEQPVQMALEAGQMRRKQQQEPFERAKQIRGQQGGGDLYKYKYEKYKNKYNELKKHLKN